MSLHLLCIVGCLGVVCRKERGKGVRLGFSQLSNCIKCTNISDYKDQGKETLFINIQNTGR